MLRSFGILFPLLAAIVPGHAASSTVYMPFPPAIIVPVSTSSFAAGPMIATNQCCSAVLSADGQTFYTAGGAIAAVDRVSGKTLHTYTTKYPIWGSAPLAIAPDQSKIYVGTCSSSVDGATCQGGNVEVLDVASGNNLAAISMGQDQVYEIQAAPNGKTVYAVHLYNFSSGDGVNRPGVSADASGGPPSNALTAINVASLKIGASFGTSPQPSGLPIEAMAITPNSLTAFVLGYDYPSQALWQVDLASMTATATLVPPPAIYQEYGGSMAISRNGATLAVLFSDSELVFFDTANASVSSSVQNVPGGIIGFSPDASLLYLQNGQDIDTLTVSTGSVNTQQTFENIARVLLSPDGSQMYWIIGSDPAIEAVQEGATTPSEVYLADGPFSWLAVSPDGGTVYSTGFNGGIWATSTANGKATVELEGQAGIVAIGVSTDGSTLFALVGDILGQIPNPRMMFVNASTGAVETTVDMPACTTSYYSQGSIAVSPDGKDVYAMYCGPTAVFDTATQSLTATINGTNVGTLALSPKGHLLFASSGGAENSPSTSISVIDTATRKLVGTIPLATAAMAFSPDGAQAYIGTSENNVAGVAVVDTSILAVTDFVPGVVPGYSPESIAVTPDGKLVYVGGPNGGVIDAKTLQVVENFKPGSPIAIH